MTNIQITEKNIYINTATTGIDKGGDKLLTGFTGRLHFLSSVECEITLICKDFTRWLFQYI